jgi:amino acid transporter
MDSVNTNTPPPEINKCNVIYEDQEYYSKSIDPNNLKTYEDNSDYYYSIISCCVILIIIVTILIIISIKKYKQNKSIILYVVVITLLAVSILSSLLIIFMPDTTLKYVGVPSDITRPCYSTKFNAILYTEEQLKDIYMNRRNKLVDP